MAPTKTFYYLVLPPFIHKAFFFCCTYPQGLSVNTIQLGWSSVRSTNWTQVKFSQCLMAYKKIMYYVYHYKLKVRYFQKKCQVISFFGILLNFFWNLKASDWLTYSSRKANQNFRKSEKKPRINQNSLQKRKDIICPNWRIFWKYLIFYISFSKSFIRISLKKWHIILHILFFWNIHKFSHVKKFNIIISVVDFIIVYFCSGLLIFYLSLFKRFIFQPSYFL